MKIKPIYISLNHNGIVKQIFLINYLNDGSFFVKDLVRINLEEKNCSILKIISDCQNTGTRLFKPSRQDIDYTDGDVKLSHHYSGKAHISGDNVTSGWDEDGKPKGFAIDSFPLLEVNDGGPVFVFQVWGLNYLRNAKTRDYVLTPDKKYIHPDHQNKNLKGFAIKGFYIKKTELVEQLGLIPNLLNYYSSVEGHIELQLIPSPENCPGIIGILSTFGPQPINDPCGFILSGAPGEIYNNKYCDTLSIMYPNKNQKTTNKLNYKK
jgi:hypothetical protein